MIPILIAGHGAFAAGLRDAVEMILGGPQEGLAALALRPEEDPAELAGRIEAALDALGVAPDAGALVLADLFGASPANAATSLLQRRPGLQVVTGASLPMALEVCLSRDTTEAPELAALAVERGREAIKDAGSFVRAAYARVVAEAQAGEVR